MSVFALSWAKKQIAGGVAAKAVLLVLADYADEKGTCWPSQETIAIECELTDRSVRDQITKLEARGLLSRAKSRKRDGTQDSDRFLLALDHRNDVPNRRNGFPADRRNDIPNQPEPPSEPAGTTFQVTTIEPPLEPNPVGLASAEAESAVDPEGPSSKWQTDVWFNKAWDSCTDEMRSRSVSRAKTHPIWAKASRGIGGEALLHRLERFLAEDADVKRTGGPAFHRWLRDGKWEHWAIPDRLELFATAPDSEWPARVRDWRVNRFWHDDWGPKPGKPGCRVPSELMISQVA